MSFDVVLALWCVAWAAVAGVCGWRYATGRSRSQREVRVAARVVRVEPPDVYGGRAAAGVGVVLAFQDPSTGREFNVPTTGGSNGRLEAAWEGRQIVVRFPPGMPFRFRMLTRPGQGRLRGLALPVVALGLLAVTLIVRFAFDVGFGLVPLGFGALWTALNLTFLVVNVREDRRRKGLLAHSTVVSGEIVAVAEQEHSDDQGRTGVTYTPVVTFTPHGAPAVTGICDTAASHHPYSASIGTRLPVRYAVADPSVFHLESAPARLASTCGIVALVLLTLAGVAQMVVGAAILLVF